MGKVRTRHVMIVVPILVVCTAFATVSATAFRGHEGFEINPHFLVGSRENREQLKALFTLLDAEGNSSEKNFAVVREISNNFFREGEYGRLIHFLGGRTVRFPEDPYNGHHFLMIAYAHMRQGSMPIAARYFDLIVKNYPDLMINGTSIHLTCLLQLIELNDDPVQQVWYYHELLSRFPDQIDRGVIWFRLAQAYERVGNWDGSIQAYANFLSQGSPVIPGFPNAEMHARHQVNFHNSARNWTFESLPALATAVRRAFDANNAVQMRNLQAGVNFFTRSWGQDDIISRQPFNVTQFMRGTRIRYADRFHERSNSEEAFLRTWGWPMVISVWYFYFRKIHFPSDPSVHGHWEWVGIYFGESF